MESKFRLARFWMQFLYEALFSSLVLAFLQSIFIKESPSMYIIPMTFALYLLSYAFREWAPNNIWMLLAHFGVIGIIYYLPLKLNMRVLFALMQVALLYTAVQYVRNEMKIRKIEDLPWPSFLTCVIIYFFSFIIKDHTLNSMAYVITILLLITYYLITYVEGLLSYVESTQDVKGIPLKRMLSSNSIVIVAIIGFLVIGLLLGRLAFVEKLAALVGFGIKKMLLYMLLAILWLINQFLKLFVPDEYMQQYRTTVDVIQNTEYKDNSFMNYIFYIAMLLLVMYISYQVLLRVIEFLLGKRQSKTDQIEFTPPEHVEIQKKKRNKRKQSIEHSLLEKARKYYRLKIQSYDYQIELKNQDTCRDIQKNVDEECQENISEITELYSSIRYGKKVVNRQIVDEMRRLSHKE